MNGIAFRRAGAPTPSSREIRSYQLRLSIPLQMKETTLPGRFQGSPYPEARSTFGFGVSQKHHLNWIDAIRSWACRSRGFRCQKVSQNCTGTTGSTTGRPWTVCGRSPFASPECVGGTRARTGLEPAARRRGFLTPPQRHAAGSAGRRHSRAPRWRRAW